MRRSLNKACYVPPTGASYSVRENENVLRRLYRGIHTLARLLPYDLS